MLAVPHCSIVSTCFVALTLAAVSGCSADRSQWQVYEENDALGGNSDRNYTQGLRIVSLSRPEDASGWVRGTACILGRARLRAPEWIRATTLRDPVSNVGWFLAQNQYTPEDISDRNIIDDDRPYAGWLQLGVIDRETLFDEKDDERRDTVSQVDFSIGVTGPPSLADETQTLWHEIFDFTEPRGWDNQLDFEPIVQANWGLAHRFYYHGLGSRFGADLAGAADGSLGTALIGLGTGATARVGWNLLRDFAPAAQEPSPFQNIHGSLRPTVLDKDAWWSAGGNWSVYGFFGGYVRAVGRNAFLDGGLFSSGHSVEREDFVNELRTGTSIRYGPYFLTYSFVIRSREFEEQDSDHHRFGSVSFGLNWLF